jgi:hypothetical protein
MPPSWQQAEKEIWTLALTSSDGCAKAQITVDLAIPDKYRAHWYHTYKGRVHQGTSGPFDTLAQAQNFCEHTLLRLRELYHPIALN